MLHGEAEKQGEKQKEGRDGGADVKLLVSNRLICDICHKTVCYYSYTHSERTVMNELKDVVCEKCFEDKDLVS